jgi:hypothetical protein
VIEALDQIHDVEDTRSWGVRIATALLLGTTAGGCLFAAALIVVGGAAGNRARARPLGRRARAGRDRRSAVFVSAAVFLAGAQLDELLRKQRSA